MICTLFQALMTMIYKAHLALWPVKMGPTPADRWVENTTLLLDSGLI